MTAAPSSEKVGSDDDETPPLSQRAVKMFGAKDLRPPAAAALRKSEEIMFEPLRDEVLTKIMGYGPKLSTSVQSLLPMENTRWFYWWAFRHPVAIGSKPSVTQCVLDAYRDGVLPKNLVSHPKVPSLENFIAQKLKNVNKSLKKEVGKLFHYR